MRYIRILPLFAALLCATDVRADVTDLSERAFQALSAFYEEVAAISNTQASERQAHKLVLVRRYDTAKLILGALSMEKDVRATLWTLEKAFRESCLALDNPTPDQTITTQLSHKLGCLMGLFHRIPKNSRDSTDVEASAREARLLLQEVDALMAALQTIGIDHEPWRQFVGNVRNLYAEWMNALGVTPDPVSIALPALGLSSMPDSEIAIFAAAHEIQERLKAQLDAGELLPHAHDKKKSELYAAVDVLVNALPQDKRCVPRLGDLGS